MSFDNTSARMVRFFDNPLPDGTTLRSKGWSAGASGAWVSLECGACDARFRWPMDTQKPRNAQSAWLPLREHLKYCPGCGKAIAGVELPQCNNSHFVHGPGGGTFYCILPVNHPFDQDHEDGTGKRWRETDKGTKTTVLPQAL